MAAAGRSFELDSLRGWAILGMALSGQVPWHVLPAWMYHAQLPPPSNELDQTTFGITWVDLVFPFFLLALGAAIPLALRRFQSWGEVWPSVLRRAGLLAIFSIVSQQLRPWAFSGGDMGAVTWLHNLLSLVLFAAIVGAWLRYPASWKPTERWLKPLSWLVVLVGLAYSTIVAVGEKSFDFVNVFSALQRIDIILMVMANVFLSGSLIWWLTRGAPAVRWYIVAVVALIFVSREQIGPAKLIWELNPLDIFDPLLQGKNFDWLFTMNYHKYLMIVLPGTILGEWILAHGSEPEGCRKKSLVASSFGLASVLICLVCLLARLTNECFFICLLLSVGAIWLVRDHAQEKRLLCLGWGLLLLGLIAEPLLTGGIRKDSTTFSYFFVAGGLGVLFYSFLRSLRIYCSWDKPDFLAWAGSNPILAYAAITNLVWPLVRLLPINAALNSWAADYSWNPWILALYDLGQTLAVGLVAGYASKKGWFLRA